MEVRESGRKQEEEGRERRRKSDMEFNINPHQSPREILINF